MRFLKFVLATIFINLVAFAQFQDETRVFVAWQVKKYDVEVSFDDRFLVAKATLNLQNVGNSVGTRVTLRINEKAEVSSVSLNGSSTSFTKGQEKAGVRNIQRILVSIPSTQPGGLVTLTVDYKLKIEENTGLNAISPVNSQFLPLAFWYPTPNSFYSLRGADFAPFKLTVNTTKTVVSSGIQNGNTFEQRLYGQIFFVTGDWDVVDVKGIKIYLPKGSGDFEKQRAAELANLFVEAKTFVASLLGTVDEVPSRIVAVRRGAGFYDAGTVLLEYGAFRRQKIDAQTAMTIAEAAARLWIGNAVLIRGEGYGAIHEGLVRYIANLFIEKQFGKEAARTERFRQQISYSAIARRELPITQISPLQDSYYASTANKGAAIWRLLARDLGGTNEFFKIIKTQLKVGALTLADLRLAFASQKESLDFWFDQINDLNLLVGLPRNEDGKIKVALRNTGSIPVSVNVIAKTETGDKITAEATIPSRDFGEVSFATTSKIVRVEVDPEKFYPQVDYSDDVAPREFDESDPILVIKRSFDKQDYATTEKNAYKVLQSYPSLDEVRVLLARSLLAEGKIAEAEKEFQAILAEALPSARSMAWASVELGEIALKSNQTSKALALFEDAIKSNAEYGSTLLARNYRRKVLPSSKIEESIKAFFMEFDKAAVSKSKQNVEKLVVPGEMIKFVANLAGQAEIWQTNVVHVDKLDSNNYLVEVDLSVKLLNRNQEKGMAVFYLSKVGNEWKLNGIEMFETK